MTSPLPAAFLRLPVAHRALHDRAQGRIENSPAAIRAAVAAGYAIEIDLQLSSDGVAMVFHDDDLDRLTDAAGRVNTRAASDLCALTLKDSTDTIPTLASVLKMIDGRVPLLIELKDQTLCLGPSDGALERATASALAGYAGPVAVMSFNPDMMAHMARLAPQIPRGLTTSSYDPADWHPVPPETCARLRDIPDYDAVAACFISHQADDLNRPRVAELKASGAAILCWTIRSPEQEAQARRMADNVTFEGYLSRLPA